MVQVCSGSCSEMKPIEMRNIFFSYEGQDALIEDASLYVDAGECVAITGSSGVGKSTLCLILAGLIPRSIEGVLRGEALISGMPVQGAMLHEVVREIGIVFQNPDSQLFAPTVEDELAFGPENIGLPREEIEKRIDYALETVGMNAYRFHSPSHLSGGQKQLVALAAVLTLSPKTLLFDEAFSQLDKEATMRIMECIKRLKAQGKAILMVEHDKENLFIADRIYALEHKKLIEQKQERLHG